jgi:hypothetical protein
MTKDPACGNGPAFAKDQLERIHQLALVGQMALHTNLETQDLSAATSELLGLISEVAATASDRLEADHSPHQNVFIDTI